jgi:hypothetical protein
MLKHREIEEEIKDLEKTKEMMNNFSKAKIEDIRRQRDHLLTEGQKLDEEIIRLNKEGDNVKKHFENQIKGMEGKLSMMDSEYNDILQKLNKKANDEQSEDLEKKEKDEQAAQNENKKAEKLRPVKFSQVEASGLDINRRLTLRRIPIDDAFELLITVNDEKDFHPKDTYFKTLNSNLHKEPFFLNKENSKLVARYLVEDNFEETVEFDIMRSQSKLTVKSIFKNLVGYVKVRELDELKKMYNEIHSAVNANRAGISSKLQDKEKRESVPVSRFIDEIRGATETVLKLNEEQKNFLIITMIERSEGSKEIKIESIFSFFSAKEFEEMYLSTGQNMGSSRKTGHKKTFTNHVRPGAKRDSVSEMSEDNKRTEGKGTSLNSSQPVNKGKQGVEVTDFGTSLAGHKSPDHQTIKEESGPKEISDDSDDLSRVSDEGPPPNFKINEVKTFNNPETKEKIYTLEQIKAAGQVKSAFGSLMFGNKKPEAADPVKKEQNSDKTDKKTTPLEFVLTKKVTYQDTNKIDQKTGAVIETMGKKFDQKEVPQENAVSTNPGNKQAIDTQNKPKEAGNQGAKSENKPSQGQTTAEPGKTVAGPPGGKTQAETGKVEQKPAGTEAVAKPPQQAKQKQPLIIDDSDDFGDEDDEIDRMLAENKGRDDEF